MRERNLIKNNGPTMADQTIADVCNSERERRERKAEERKLARYVKTS